MQKESFKQFYPPSFFSTMYWVIVYTLIVFFFTLNHWPQHANIASGFMKSLSLFLAIPITTLVWLAFQRRIYMLLLLLPYSLIASGLGILLEYVVYNEMPTTPSSLLFYGVLLSIGISGTLAIMLGHISVSFPFSFKQSVKTAFILCCILFITPIAFLSYERSLALAQPSDETGHIGTPIPKHVLATQTFIAVINQKRVEKGLTSLYTNTQLNEASRLIIEKLAANPTLIDTNDISNKDKNSVITASGYAYASIADIASLVDAQDTETTIVAGWARKADLALVLFDKTFEDIGLSVKTSGDNTLVYALFGTSKKIKQSVVAKTPNPTPIAQTKYFTGVELFSAVNSARKLHGVGELQQANSLCTVASIRLNQQLELKKIDNHEGFNAVLEKYKDQLPYAHISENLAQGYETAAATVTAWEGSPGHSVLLKDGSYVWGCTAANLGFSVLIAAY